MHASDSGDAELNLTPLLDVVLQLIMFFLITVNFEREDQFTGGILPTANTTGPIDSTNRRNWVMSDLYPDGKLVVRGVESVAGFEFNVSDTRLESKCVEYLRRKERYAGYNNLDFDPIYVLRADKDVRYEFVHNSLEMWKKVHERLYPNKKLKWEIRVLRAS
jgi:biopolymer transport protein ExbD